MKLLSAVFVLSIAAVCAVGFLSQSQAASSDSYIWPVVYEADYRQPECRWAVTSDEYGSGRCVDGTLELEAKSALRAVNAWLPDNRQFLDFAIEFDVRVIEGAGEWGVQFRWDGNSAYLLAVDTAGRYQVRMRQRNSWHVLVDWTEASGFRADDGNRLMVVAQGASFSFYLNGETVGTFSNDVARAGQVGIHAASFGDTWLVVRFDNLVVREDIDMRAIAGELETLFERSQQIYASRDLEQARSQFQQVLRSYQGLGWRKREADCALWLGRCCLLLGEHLLAIKYFEESWVTFHEIGYREDEGRSLGNLGICYDLLGDYRRAIGFMEQAVVIFREIGCRECEALTYIRLGICYHSLGDYREAIDFLEQALTIEREIGDRVGEAWGQKILGDCYRALSEYQRAIGYYEQSLEISVDIGDRARSADNLVGLGTCHHCLSDYQLAIEYYEQSLAIFVDIRDRAGEAKSLGNLGNCYHALSDYQRAIDCYEQSLAIFVEIGYRASEAGSLIGLGLCYRSLSDYQRAIQYYEQSLAIFVDIRDRAGEAISLGNLGTCYFFVSDCERAIEYYEQSLAINREIGDRLGEANNLAGLANCHYSLSDCHWAINCLEQSLAISVEIGDRASEARALGNLGSCYHSLSGYPRAIDYYEQSLALSVELGVRETERRAHWGLGQTYRKLKDYEAAVTHYETAIEIVESIRGRVEDEELRQSYFGSVRTLYEEYLELLLETGRNEETLFVPERCRARTFLDLLAMGPVGIIENVAEEGIRTGAVDASVIESDLTEVVAGLPASTAALEYFVTEETTYLWLVRAGSASDPIQITIARSDLREQVLEFRTAIETSSAALSDAPDEDTLTMSRDLYDLLIAPAEDQLEGIDHLVIVPSGPLYYLPFCALIECPDCAGLDLLGGEYLIERYALSYTPSLTTLKYAQASAEGADTDPLFLALADPDSGDPELLRLPDAQDEAEAVAALFDPSEVYVDTAATEDVVMARASSADHLLLSTHGVFNPLNPMFSYLLLSPTEDSDGRLYTHEIFSLDLHTDLVTLSACETLLPALGDIEAQVRAVRGMPEEEAVELDEDLMETLTAGDEIVGLTRAFIYAGTPSVLSSLWRVVSETTEPLMVAFYGYVADGLDKADALQRAQRDVMASYPHPRYWAAFELVGDWRAQW